MMCEFGSRIKKRCPHDDVQFCPLYVASNVGAGGCDDGNLARMSCAVDRGTINYSKEVAKLAKTDKQLINDCDDREWRAQSKAQRKRNMRMNGIH